MVCRYCGKNFSNSNSTSSSNISSISYNNANNNYWYCSKCGCSNLDNTNWCKSCNSPRYTMSTITDNQKEIVMEFVEKQLAEQNFEEIKKFQDSYFGTSSLKFMKYMLPDANGFDNLDLYKTKLKESIQEEKPEKEDDSAKKQEAVSSIAQNGNDLEIELTKIKNLFEKKLITEEEYKAKKNQLLGL